MDSEPAVGLPTSGRSLRTKLVRTMTGLLLIVATTTLLVVAGMNYVASRATLANMESQLREAIHAKGGNLVASQALALRDLVADNAFSDVARLLERTVDQDEDMVYGLFLDESSKPWAYAARGKTPDGAAPRDWATQGVDGVTLRAPGIHSSTRQLGAQTVFEFAAPVVNDAGDYMGSLRYALSGRTLQRALTAARQASRDSLMTTIMLLAVLGGAAILMGMMLTRRAASRITQPLGQLTAAVGAFAAGRRDIRVSISSGDELQALGIAFNHMGEEIAQAYHRLEEMNRGLEEKVQERTRALGIRNRDMRLVLDNVEQGFLTLSADGRLAQERSAIVDRWFGAYGPEATFTEYMTEVDPTYAETFALGYEALLEDVLPRDLCLAQLPTRIHHAGGEFRCSYFALGQGQRTEGLLVVINDVTVELLTARREDERNEVLAMFEVLCRDRAGLLAFVDETNEQMATLQSADLEGQKRLVHTLKGNCSLMGMGVIAALCHEIEETMAERHSPASALTLRPLEERWRDLTQALHRFLGEGGRDAIELSMTDLERLDKDIKLGASLAQVQERLASWWLEPTERPLSRLGNHARALATRLRKGDLNVIIDSGAVRLAPKAWVGIWTDLVHVVRNAVDHGIESPGVRRQNGKSERPEIRLATESRDGMLIIEIADDGAGIDWAAVRRAAIQRGLPHDSEDDLMKAIFATDLTTRLQVSMTSGRGIGLAAVHQRVESMGGTISVHSRLGAGTRFRFTFPLAEATLNHHVQSADHETSDVPSPGVLLSVGRN